jgi:hypothetical protein
MQFFQNGPSFCHPLLIPLIFVFAHDLFSIALASPDPRAYVEWAHSLGIDSANVTLFHTPLAGWSVKAARPIRKGEIFL